MSWYKELIELLPTKWARLTFSASIVFSVAAYNFPVLVPASILHVNDIELFLIKLLLFTAVLCAGFFVTLCVVVCYTKKLETERNKSFWENNPNREI